MSMSTLLYTDYILIIPAACMCIYSTIKSDEPPIQNSNVTKILFHGKVVIVFATTLDWTGVKGISSSFSNGTCQYLGKVKHEIPRKESMVTAQDGFDHYVSIHRVTVYAYTFP